MKEQRRAFIETYLEKNNEASTKELQSQFKVSINTLRSDLDYLVENKVIRKVYGGVQYIRNPEHFHRRAKNNLDSKAKISRLAASYIKSNDTIYVDYGTTTMLIPDFIPENVSNVTLITANMFVIQNCVNKDNINLIVLPGEFQKAIYGVASENTLRELENYNIGKAFMSNCGITHDGGIGVYRFIQKDIKSTIMQRSRQKYLLSESRKFQDVPPLVFSSLSNFDELITDNKLSEEHKALCKSLHCKYQLAT